MVDILKMGSNSLHSLTQALATTGHNITNANTEGYSRQTVHFETHESLNMGFGYLGQGSKVSSVERSYNTFLTSQVQDFSSSKSRYQTFTEFSARVDNILASSENSLNTSIQKFFSALGDVAANPANLPERQAMIGEANNLVDRQHTFTNLLQDLNAEVNAGLSFGVAEINGLADSIATLNKEITTAISAGNGSSPNDLLDQRDRLIKDLAEKVGVTTSEQDDGAVNVFIGKGQALVVGSQTTHLSVQNNPTDSSRLEIAVAGNLSVSGKSEFVSGGSMQGLLDFRSRVLQPAQTQLGLIALGLTETVNAQHNVGMDLNGSLGSDFFKALPIDVAGNVQNAGSAAPVVTLTNVSQVRASDYSLFYDGSQWQMTRLSDNTNVSGAGPLVLDGMSVDLSAGTPLAGDSFVINPARSAAENFNLAISDPRKIAAGIPVKSTTPSSNVGLAAVTGIKVEPTNTLPLSGAITLTFNPDALGIGVPGFDVVGGPGGTLAYDPATESAGKSFTFATEGISFTLANVPQAGDSFQLSNNSGATGDNRNLLQIASLQHEDRLDGGKASFQEFYGSVVARVGVITNEASSNLSVETSLLQQATDYRDSASGVNLDEEAANLLRFQQAYQASAQLIKIADDLFQTLISSIR